MLMLLLTWGGAVHAKDPTQVAFADGARAATLPAPQLALDGSLPATPLRPWIDIRVKPGDTLSGLFRRAGLKSSQWQTLLALGNVTEPLRQLHPGDRLELQKTPGGHLVTLHFPLNSTQTLVVRRAAGDLTAYVRRLQATTRRVLVRGTVDTSFAVSARESGAPRSVANELAHIFDTRQDLSKIIQPGDRFSIVYEARYVHGQKIGPGPVLAASLHANGTVERVFRQTGTDGIAQYYDATGKPYAPGIERTPLHYTRVSSPFSMHRRNPALGVVRPHAGVDLAAPRGTPVDAAGDGVVTFVGWRTGYGRLIKIRHGGGYSTRYAHLADFATGLDVGDHVQQGQVIAHVGESGLATGYHLHFEIRKNDIPHNPLTMPLPDGEPLSGPILTAFTSRIQLLIARLSGAASSPTLVASATSFSACPESGAINAVLALAPSQVDNSQLNRVFCTIGG